MPRTVSPRADPGSQVERVPWSVLGPQFTREWGRPGGKAMPEHMEVLGPTGSGKSFFLRRILADRVAARQTAAVYIATKPADDTIASLGWPITDTWRGVQQNPQVIFWPRTKARGPARKAYQAQKLSDLLGHLWVPDSNTIVIWDEITYIERLRRDIADDVEMYLREGRTMGITNILGKQRPQGVTREMHAETSWVVSFQPADRADAERTAELFGAKKEFVPLLEGLDLERHEFLIQYRKARVTYVSWIDDGPGPPAPRNPR